MRAQHGDRRRTERQVQRQTQRRATARMTTRLVGVALLAVALGAACTPPPTGPAPDPAPPVIHSFQAFAARGEAPVTASYAWGVSDPNGDALTCRLDVDGDLTWDRTYSPCSSGDLGLANFTTPGDRVAILEVSDGDFPPVTATTTVPVAPGPSESFDITLRLPAGMRPEFAAAFQAAADRWEQVITAGLPDQQFTLLSALVPWAPPFDGTVDDLLIDATAVDIDGVGGTLGQAGSLAVRADGTSIYGIMQFDAADLDRMLTQGRLRNLILHEMGHVLGIGLGWALRGLLVDVFTSPRYTGTAANAAWQEIGGTGLVPVESGGGIGTALAHWSEPVFNNELMTGYSDPAPEPLSRITVGGLADLGYGVDLSAADAYALPGPSVLGRSPVRTEVGDGSDHLHTTPVFPPQG